MAEAKAHHTPVFDINHKLGHSLPT